MKTVIEMAREAGLQHVCDINYPVVDVAIECFAALVRKDEREACAKVCEELDEYHETMFTTEACAAAIRARGE